MRDIARRDDPDFERRMRASIYGNAARIGRAADAIAAAEPALRRAVDQVQRDMDAAIDAPPPGPPPGDADDDSARSATTRDRRPSRTTEPPARN